MFAPVPKPSIFILKLVVISPMFTVWLVMYVLLFAEVRVYSAIVLPLESNTNSFVSLLVEPDPKDAMSYLKTRSVALLYSGEVTDPGLSLRYEPPSDPVDVHPVAGVAR